MRLLLYFFCQKETGFGHWFRSLALAQAAQARGHTVFVASDRQPPGSLAWLPAVYNDPVTFARALQAAAPDWLIVDLPHTPPEWIRVLSKCKICTLNGIGYNQNDGADLRVIQGVADLELPGPQDKVPVLKGLEYVILRPEIEQYKGLPRSQDWLCWGGGADVMQLFTRFSLACPGWFATFIVTSMAPAPIILTPTQTCVRPNPETPEIFEWMAGSKSACVAMGMCTWELAYLGTPGYVLSATPLHLRFAQGMARLGLIKAWPEVGVPEKDRLRAFLEEEFEVAPNGLDLGGAGRVMEAIENYG